MRATQVKGSTSALLQRKLLQKALQGPTRVSRRLPRPCLVTCNAASPKIALVSEPPKDWDFNKQIRDASDALIAERYPQLLKLARSGALIVVPRPSDYVERRSDGYREPELVFVVGSVHLSQRSADAVRQTIECVRPQNVVVELCRSRAAALYADDNTVTEEVSINSRASAASHRASSLQKAVRDALAGRQSGPALLLRLLADSLSARMQTQAGVRSGVEMRAARAAAELCGAQLVLGDRPIEITWQRAWDALSFKRKLQLGGELLKLTTRRLPDLEQRDVDALESDDAVRAMTQTLSAEYPEVASALLHERDLYLAWSLKRSKAVCGCEAVVGVVGRGHLRGVAYHLQRDSGGLRFRDLVGDRRRSQTAGARRWVPIILGNVALAAGLSALWDVVRGHSPLTH